MQATSLTWKWLRTEGGKGLPSAEYEGSVVSFDNPGYTYPRDLEVNISSVQSGSGDPSPENVRPITGWTGANVAVTDVTPDEQKKYAILPNQEGTGDPSPTNIRPITPGLALTRDDGSTLTVYGGTLDVLTGMLTVTKAYLDLGTQNWTLSSLGGARFYTSVKAIYNTGGPVLLDIISDHYKSADWGSNDLSISHFNNVIRIRDSNCENMTTAEVKTYMSGKHAVYPLATPVTYQLTLTEVSRAMTSMGIHGTIYPITWQSTAGTVYGGTLDVLTGVLTVTHQGVVYDGSNDESWALNTVSGYYRYRVLVDNALNTGSGRYPVISNIGMYKSNGNGAGIIFLYPGTSKQHLYYYPPQTIQSVTAFRAWLSNNNLQVVYELATPETYQLTPTEVSLLAGTNVIYSDTGDTTIQLESPKSVRVETKAVFDGTDQPLNSAPVIGRAAMQGNLSVGNVVSAALLVSVRTGAAIARSAGVEVSVRLTDGETASEWLPAGTFYISRRTRDPVTGTLALECYDALLKANAIWEPSSGAWPRAMASVVSEFLTLLGVSLDSRTAIPSGAAFVISEPTEGTTIREVLGAIAQAGGGNWIMTPAGKLRLVPLKSAAGAATAADDVADVTGVVGGIGVNGGGTITGVRDTWEGDVYLTGDDDGIVLDVSIPPAMAAETAEGLIGQSYQAYSLTGAIYDPAAEMGDYVRGGTAGEVASVLYSEQVTLGPAFRGDLGAPEAAELADEYPYIGASARTLALAKASVREAVDALDEALDQQEIFDRLTDNGDAQGLILYNGDLYINASFIQTGTLNAALANVINLNADNITSGAISADRIRLNEYDPNFLIPDENDASTLFSGQSISNGWIVQSGSGGLIDVLKIPNAAAYRGMQIDVSLTSIDQVYGGSEYVMHEDTSEDVSTWTSPSYGQVDSTGALVGATMEGSYYKFKMSFTIPNDADVFEVSFSASGVRGISVSTGVAGTLNLRYLNNVSIDETGLQVGKFIVDRTGNATFNAGAVFNGNVSGLVAADIGILTGTTTTIAVGTTTVSLTGLTSDHRVLSWGFSSGGENDPPADITITTGSGSYTIDVSNVVISGVTMTPVFFKP